MCSYQAITTNKKLSFIKQAIKDSKMNLHRSNMALHRNIKKSLLFTVHMVDNKITCVRCNLTGRFVKRSIYFAIEKETTTEHGSIIDFNTVSLFDDYINVLNVLFLALFSVTSVSVLTLSVLSVSLINLFL